MINTILPQMVVILLLMTSPLIVRKGLPSFKSITKLFTSARRSFRLPTMQRKMHRRTMRGARPWWQ